MEVMPDDESVSAANHARGLQFGCDPPSGVARMQKHKRLPCRRHRLHQRPSQPSPGGEDSEQKQCDNDAHLTNSLDERRSLVVGHWSLAVGHLGRAAAKPILSALPGVHPALQDQDGGHLIDHLSPPLD